MIKGCLITPYPQVSVLLQARTYKPQDFMTAERFSLGACIDALSPSRRAYLECRQAEAISQIVSLLFGDLLFTQPQPQLLKGDHTDVAGHVVTLRVQRVGLAGVKVVNKATFVLNTQKKKEILNKVSYSWQLL